MLIKRSKEFSRLSYSGLNESAKKMLKESRDRAARELKIKRVSLEGVKDKNLKNALRETYLMGAKHKAEISRRAAEILHK